MKIIGDLKHATKFCVDTPDKGIRWVSDLEIAKAYASNPNNKDWYNRTIIATYEQIVEADDGKCYFKSQAPKKTIEQKLEDNLVLFKKQSKKKITIELEKYAASKGFDSFLELISFSTSTVKSYKDLAKEAIKYRDKLYSYTDKFFTRFDDEEVRRTLDVSNIYDDYLHNFPFM